MIATEESECTRSERGDAKQRCAPTAVDCGILVRRVQAGDPAAVEELYMAIGDWVRPLFYFMLGRDEGVDHLHDTFLAVLKGVQLGCVRDSNCLPGYVRAIARRQIAAALKSRTRCSGTLAESAIPSSVHDLEETAVASERRKMMLDALMKLANRDRELLVRFYLRCQSKEQIMAEMGLTETQFRLRKSRAKARCVEVFRLHFVPSRADCRASHALLMR